MRVVLQRTKEAKVIVENQITGIIDSGILVLVGFEDSDSQEDIAWISKKVLNLRIFDDENGVMNRSVLDSGGNLLVISQFTLHANTKKGNRPSYIKSAKGEISEPLYNKFVDHLKRLSKLNIQTGIFGAYMKVHLINDGPVTIIIDSKNKGL